MNQQHKNKKEIKAVYLMFLILIPLTLPDYYLRNVVIENISIAFVMIIFSVTMIYTIMKKKLNILIVFVFVYMIWRSFSSYYYAEEVLDLTNSLKTLTLILSVNLFIEKYPKSIISAFSGLFSIYIYINLISLYLYPDGLYIIERSSIGSSQGWILGVENQFAYVIIPGAIFNVLNSLYKYNKINIFTWITIGISFLSLIKVWTATGIVSLLFVIIFALLMSFKKKVKFINFNVIVVFYIIIWYSVINIEKVRPIQYLVVEVLNKDLTLSFRTIIWDKVLEVIPNSLLFGHGINTYVLAGKVTSFAAHNLLLQIILDSGVIGILLFLICIIVAGKNLQSYKENTLSLIILVGIFSIMIGGIAESYRTTYLFVLLMLAYNINLITDSFNLRNILVYKEKIIERNK